MSLRNLLPRNGSGTWDYPCPTRSRKGRECVHPSGHGVMHKDAHGYFWTSERAA